MGVMLSCPREGAPGQGAAFVVVTDDLRITAISEGAETLLGPEAERLGATLLSVLTSPNGNQALGIEVARAANGSRYSTSVSAAVAGKAAAPGLRAWVSSCGPPRAALILLAPPADL